MRREPRKTVDEWLELCETASSCECTGLMPRPPRNQGEQKAYEDLFSMEVSQSETE